MKEYMINIGEVKTFREPTVMTCYGLGSCIGLFLQDRISGLSGSAHIFSSKGTEREEGKFYEAKDAIAELIRQISCQIPYAPFFRAKLAGGANVLGSYSDVGDKNAECVISDLINRGVFISAKDVGGILCRTARFDSGKGTMMVRTPESRDYKIF